VLGGGGGCNFTVDGSVVIDGTIKRSDEAARDGPSPFSKPPKATLEGGGGGSASPFPKPPEYTTYVKGAAAAAVGLLRV